MAHISLQQFKCVLSLTHSYSTRPVHLHQLLLLEHFHHQFPRPLVKSDISQLLTMNHFPRLKTSEGPISLFRCIIPTNLIATKQSTACIKQRQVGFSLPTACSLHVPLSWNTVKLQYMVLQEKKGNILGDDNIGHCDDKSLYEHV
jgi:hypothetical protein